MGFLVFFVPPLLLGTFFLARGLRGRRVDDHPVCRACGFDLFNRPPGSERCAECGADLTRAGAIRDGRRERRRGWVAAGALMLAVALAVGGGAGYARFAAADAQKLKPAWWLVREIDSGDPAVAVAAAKELAARVTAGKLAQRYVDATADKLLAVQADSNAKWDAAFGDFIEDARLAKQLSDPRFHRYAQQAPGFNLVVRPRVNRGDRVPFMIHEGDARVGSRRTLLVKYSTDYAIDSIPIGTGGLASADTLTPRGGGGVGSAIDLKKHLDQIPDGPHEAHVTMNQSFHLANAAPNAPPMFWTKRKLSAPFQLLPAEPSTVEIVRDEALRPAIEKALSVEPVEYQRWAKGWLGLTVRAEGLPVDVGFDVVVVADGKEHTVTTFASKAQGPNSSSGHSMSVNLPNFAGGPIDVIFRPNPAAAKATRDVFGIWDGEIVKRGLPVKMPPSLVTTPAPAPAATTPAPATRRAS